jgi:hypothetical protein
MTDDTPDRLLAELHVARALANRPPRRAARGVTATDLWANLGRAPGAPVSLAVARSLRDDPGVATRYRRMLEAIAIAHAPVALAASDGVALRRIGEATLRLLPATTDAPPLLVIENTTAAALELIGADGDTLRLALPPADAGTIIMALGDDFPEAAAVLTLLAAATTALFLLP